MEKVILLSGNIPNVGLNMHVCVFEAYIHFHGGVLFLRDVSVGVGDNPPALSTGFPPVFASHLM